MNGFSPSPHSLGAFPLSSLSTSWAKNWQENISQRRLVDVIKDWSTARWTTVEWVSSSECHELPASLQTAFTHTGPSTLEIIFSIVRRVEWRPKSGLQNHQHNAYNTAGIHSMIHLLAIIMRILEIVLTHLGTMLAPEWQAPLIS